MSEQLRLSLLAVGLAAMVVTAESAGQTPDVHDVGQATDVVRRPFREITAVRELRDGRLVLIDRIGIATYVIALRTESVTRLFLEGDTASGVRIPLRLFALRDDTTLVLDVWGGGGPLVILTHGKTVRVTRFAGTRAERLAFNASSKVDASGRVYQEVPRGSGGGDSAEIERYDRSQTQRQRLATIARRPKRAVQLLPNGAVRAESKPFETIDDWAVAPDGRIAIVTASPYRVHFVDPSGSRITGPVLSHDPVLLSEPLKRLWNSNSRQIIPVIRGGSDGMHASFQRPAASDQGSWPRVLPPFLDNAAVFGPDGSLWISRTHAAEDRPVIDVIDRIGRRVRQVRLPMHTRLVGFGMDVMYLARQADGQEYLQRHAMR